DGHATDSLTLMTCPAPIVPAMYFGGIEDGHGTDSLTLITCPAPVVPAMYLGGIEDGFSGVFATPSCGSGVNFTGSPLSVCPGDTVFFTDLTTDGPFIWSWTFVGGTPASSTAQNPMIVYSTPGTYDVKLVATNGLGTDSVTQVGFVTVNTLPTPVIVTADTTIFCQGDSAVLDAGAGFTGYLWSNGDTTQTTTIKISGNYMVTVTDVNSCNGTSTPDTVTVIPSPPAFITPSPIGPYCIGDTVILTANPADIYSWSPGSDTTQAITVTASGSYFVTLTDTLTGCSATSAPETVIVGAPPTAVITPGGPTTFCQGDSVILTAGPADTYSWSPGGDTTQAITVTASGSYFATLTDTSTGCNATSSPETIIVGAAPIASITPSGPTTFCQGDSIVLTASPADSYSWSPGGDTTQAITVTASGSYFATLMDTSTGCSATSAPETITVTSAPTAVITPSGSTTICQGDSVILTASLADNYAWSPGGDTTQAITVSTAGSYLVTLTDTASGCSATSAPVTVSVGAAPIASITPGGPTSFCQGDSVLLTSSPANSYSWSPGGDTTQTISVSTAGSYFVTLTDTSTGCSVTSAPETVTVGAAPVATITPSGSTNFCLGDSVVLTASISDIYSWSPGGDTTQVVTVSTAGSYVVTLTDTASGCNATSAPVTITVGAAPTASITPSGPTSFCQGDSVVLTASPADEYTWLPGGDTTQAIIVSTAGSYFVTSTDTASGCSATSAPETVTVGAAPTVAITASGPTSFCQGDSILLTAGPADNYSWSPGGDTSQTITVTTTGSYFVTLTDTASGCSATSAPLTVTVGAAPTASITTSGPMSFCQGDSVILTAGPANNYTWSPGGDTTQAITVSAAGSYFVTATDTATGCSATSAPETITVGSVPTATITPSGTTAFCQGDSVMLTAGPADNYTWSPGGETTQSITVSTSGSYFVTLTDTATTCSVTSAPEAVTVGTAPTASITPSGATSFCQGDSVVLTANPADSYLWSPGGETTQAITVKTAGSYFVTLTDTATGCSSTSSPESVTIGASPTAAITASGSTNFCQGGSVVLTANTADNYLWTPGGDTTQSITVSASGTYAVLVSDSSGSCFGTDNILVSVNALPVADAGPDESTTQDSCVVLNATGGIGYVWSPSTNLTDPNTQSPTACPGETSVFYVTVTDINGCSALDSVTITIIEDSPVASVLSIPNTFTPNGDGKNEMWVIRTIEQFPTNVVNVYNRWGDKVFSANPYLNEWDGSSLGKQLPDATYYYIVDLGDGTPAFRGTITIIR
ncbi:MAG: gliding motility-associated C-terminal domain-containing protein, partial [Flavobacteriales bacterium]|nr:gliding motility-associated C-terminal domain-containing protein [Flavobacteriales bacterium]